MLNKCIARNLHYGSYLRLRNGVWSVSRNIMEAQTATEQKLRNVIKDNRAIRIMQGDWEFFDPEAQAKPVSEETHVPESDELVVHKNELQTPPDVVKVVGEFLALFNQKNFDELRKAHSDVEKEVSDLYHCIEFNSMNAYEGWMAYDELRKVLAKRRKIKEYVRAFQIVMGNRLLDLKNPRLAELAQESRTAFYQPRIRTDLFDETKENLQ